MRFQLMILFDPASGFEVSGCINDKALALALLAAAKHIIEHRDPAAASVRPLMATPIIDPSKLRGEG